MNVELSPERKLCACPFCVREMNRAVRTDDGGAGFMVGAGLHFSYAGLVEAFKAHDGKRSHDDWSTAASMLHMAAKSFVALFSGARYLTFEPMAWVRCLRACVV